MASRRGWIGPPRPPPPVADDMPAPPSSGCDRATVEGARLCPNSPGSCPSDISTSEPFYRQIRHGRMAPGKFGSAAPCQVDNTDAGAQDPSKLPIRWTSAWRLPPPSRPDLDGRSIVISSMSKHDPKSNKNLNSETDFEMLSN